jgi:two-component system, OmpR family, phosphate regulon sensor histidine kinase PhoR
MRRLRALQHDDLHHLTTLNSLAARDGAMPSAPIGPLNAPSLEERAMRETEGLIKATETSGTFGTARTAERPATWSVTTKGAAQMPVEFASVLLAVAGHDLRQPLQAIQSAHEMLGLGVRTESELRLLRYGQSAIDRLRNELDQLLAALRLREHAEGMKLMPVPVGPLLRQVRRESEIAALRKGVSVRIVETTATIYSNALLLTTILRNLVSNAIKYTQPGDRILLGCRHAGQSVRIDVYDTGIGIAGDQMPRIFEAFTRLDPARRGGLGVGLFIVRQAVGLLGHRVDINSTPSQGSRFSIFATKGKRTAEQPRQDGRETRSGAQP